MYVVTSTDKASDLVESGNIGTAVDVKLINSYHLNKCYESHNVEGNESFMEALSGMLIGTPHLFYKYINDIKVTGGVPFLPYITS